MIAVTSAAEDRPPPATHEQHELAGADRQPGPLEQREEAALGVDLVDELAGDADRVLDQRGVLLDGGVEVDVLLAPGEVEDVGQLLLALVHPAEQADGEEGQAAADEDDRGELGGAHRSSLPVGDARAGCGTRTLRPRTPAAAASRSAGPAGALKADAGTSTLSSPSLSTNFGPQAGGHELAGAGRAGDRCGT